MDELFTNHDGVNLLICLGELLLGHRRQFHLLQLSHLCTSELRWWLRSVKCDSMFETEQFSLLLQRQVLVVVHDLLALDLTISVRVLANLA